MKTLRLILTLLAIATLLSQCNRDDDTVDVNFAKATFESLARGDSAVAEKIDWETFTAMDANLGATYVNLPTEQERADFIRAFITQFAAEFRESGGSVINYSNWRVSFRDATRKEVLADSPRGNLKMIITYRDSIRRVASIDVLRGTVAQPG